MGLLLSRLEPGACMAYGGLTDAGTDGSPVNPLLSEKDPAFPESGRVAHTCVHSTLEVETGTPQVQGHPCSEIS